MRFLIDILAFVLILVSSFEFPSLAVEQGPSVSALPLGTTAASYLSSVAQFFASLRKFISFIFPSWLTASPAPSSIILSFTRIATSSSPTDTLFLKTFVFIIKLWLRLDLSLT